MATTQEYRRPAFLVVALVCLAVFLLIGASCPYQKMKPTPDVDKGPPAPPPPAIDNSCWMATASSILAGAGYGNGVNVQQRADNIYADMVANYGKTNRGWPDAALQWWLGSAHNTWAQDPYTVVAYYGNKTMDPWNDANIPEFVGNELRKCNFVGFAFSWPTDAPGQVGYGGHATTPMGDNFGKNTLSINPTQVRMADSDRDGGGDIQVYNYDAYNNPNPGGADEGKGCYFDYSANHPYVRGAVTLTPTDNPSDNKLTQKVVGSYRIHQTKEIAATDLHYKVGTDTTILTYNTSIDWDNTLTPTIVESQPQRTEITAEWDLSTKAVPQCKWITITTEFVLPYWNAMTYSDVHFTYPRTMERVKAAEIAWKVTTPEIRDASKIQDVTGGYVIGAFDIVRAEGGGPEAVVGEYRFIHQYSFNQSPEHHLVSVRGERGLYLTNIRVGHSYGLLRGAGLWRFDSWMTEVGRTLALSDEEVRIPVDWTGRLPYPKGIDIRDSLKEIREKKTGSQPQLKRETY